MSKMLEKIKKIGHSLVTMFQEKDQAEDAGYLDPDSNEGQKLANAMKPFVDEINKLEVSREAEEKARIESINKDTSKKLYSKGIQRDLKIEEAKYLDPSTEEGQKLASAMNPITEKINKREQDKKARADKNDGREV